MSACQKVVDLLCANDCDTVFLVVCWFAAGISDILTSTNQLALTLT